MKALDLTATAGLGLLFFCLGESSRPS
jgi:hypothetical protein